jgi:DNA topoisomerase-6 subunit B
VVVEVAVARLVERTVEHSESSVQVLRFANRVPLQFDKSGCAIVHAIESVNWKTYGLAQPKDSLPQGPYVIAVSLVSPFIKFKNASKETVDASDELVNELRLTLIQAGQKLSRHIRAENRAIDLENKIRHMEQFGPILVDAVCRIVNAPEARKKKATAGLMKILGRESRAAEKELAVAVQGKEELAAKQKMILGQTDDEGGFPAEAGAEEAAEGGKATGKKTKGAKTKAAETETKKVIKASVKKGKATEKEVSAKSKKASGKKKNSKQADKNA